jgi:hypothetical protein
VSASRDSGVAGVAAGHELTSFLVEVLLVLGSIFSGISIIDTKQFFQLSKGREASVVIIEVGDEVHSWGS